MTHAVIDCFNLKAQFDIFQVGWCLKRSQKCTECNSYLFGACTLRCAAPTEILPTMNDDPSKHLNFYFPIVVQVCGHLFKLAVQTSSEIPQMLNTHALARVQCPVRSKCGRHSGFMLCLAAHLGCRNLSRKSGNCEAKGIGERCPVLPTNSLAHSHPCPLFIKCLLSSPLFSRVRSGVTCFMEKNDWCDIFLRNLNVNLRYFSCAFKL